MNIWLCLLIPIISALIMLKWFPKYMAWWEGVVPLVACFIFIIIFKFSVEKIQTTDTEYHGAIIVEARYYEYWETYVRRTCTRTVSCGKNCTRTVTYDCSYCDKNPEHWTAVNSLGQEFSISKEYYNFLMKKWGSVPQFVDMNRRINNGGWGCGQDGDMYRIVWNGQPLTAEATTTDHYYENRVQAAHTSFDFVDVTKEDIKEFGLYDYADIKGIDQETVLGLDQIKWAKKEEIDLMKQWSKFINGYLGPRKHARIYFLFFADKQPLAANMQEAYWAGGNDNELVICIGLNQKTREIQWVRPFTWSPERKIIPDIREQIMAHKTFNPENIAHVVWNKTEKLYQRKDFKEFSYITVNPPDWAIWVTFFITLGLSFGLCWWAVHNQIDSEYDPLKDLFTGKKRNRYGNW